MPKIERFFVKCEHCGKKIYFGNDIYHQNGLCTVYCSGECYAAAYGAISELTPELSLNCACEVFKESEITTIKDEKLSDEETALFYKRAGIDTWEGDDIPYEGSK